jgi:glycine/sarcosine N-methyltransferase
MKPTIHVENFYDELSPYYHLISENWDTDIENDGKIIASLLRSSEACGAILDCSCGIGTQLIALKQLGYDVEGSDISNDEVVRASQEAKKRNLAINIRVDDMRTLRAAPQDYYEAVLTIGNSLPHLLSEEEILESFISMKNVINSKGFVLVGVRDYKPILSTRIQSTEPRFLQDRYGKRIVHQIWDWHDERIYTVHLYITRKINEKWEVKHFVGTYRAITLEEIKSLMEKAGLTNISILYPETTNFCQPIIKAYK